MKIIDVWRWDHDDLTTYAYPEGQRCCDVVDRALPDTERGEVENVHVALLTDGEPPRCTGAAGASGDMPDGMGRD